ncbi:MAG TPA: diphosphomevalonate decarboxylase [Gammaproteobacteria bacterium]|nr:diphosphomevalonate decarboxylase [Gammaproteobacteria bacterium]
MKRSDVVSTILAERKNLMPKNAVAKAYAPSNIALCKYWGKREQELNLPVTSSLSISLGNKGAMTEISVSGGPYDVAYLNHQPIDWISFFGKRLLAFLDLFRVKRDLHFTINITTNIPIGAGLASSACGFASLTRAMDLLFGWELKDEELSILARLGSGSASRSLWHGFVEWHVGIKPDGMDSYGESIADEWPELCIGLLILNEKEKPVSSRDAMQRTVTTSPLYSAWPAKVNRDLSALKQAINLKDFLLLGKTAESNAMTMHATMLSAWPTICYFLPETITAMNQIWKLRQEGLMVFFTQDAGPNLKLIFLEKNILDVKAHFPDMEIIKPFADGLG